MMQVVTPEAIKFSKKWKLTAWGTWLVFLCLAELPSMRHRVKPP